MLGRDPGEPDAAQPMIDWILGAPPAELAAELMSAFDPEGAKRDAVLGVSDFNDWMFRGYPPPSSGWIQPARPVREPILEAVQLLEHSELIYVRWVSDSDFRWSATRLGVTALASGKVAVRQRIKDRTGL